MRLSRFVPLTVVGAACVFMLCGSAAKDHAAAQENTHDISQPITPSVDTRMLQVLSLSKSERSHELAKYGITKLVPPEKRLGKIEEAMQHYEMAVKLMKIANCSGARLRLNKALQIEPNFIEAHLLYADLYVILGNKQLELKHRELAKIAERTTYSLTEQRDFLRVNAQLLTDLFRGDNRVNIILRTIAVLVMIVLIGSLFQMSALHEKEIRAAEYRKLMGDGTFKRDESIEQLVAKMKGHSGATVHKFKLYGVYGIPFVFFLVLSNLFNFQGAVLLLFCVIPAVIYDLVIYMVYFKKPFQQH
jgi:hypothetical protein